MSARKGEHKNDVPDGKLDQSVTPCEPTFEEIRAQAYEVYVQRGRIDGFDLEDWLQAENELRKKGDNGAE